MYCERSYCIVPYYGWYKVQYGYPNAMMGNCIDAIAPMVLQLLPLQYYYHIESHAMLILLLFSLSNCFFLVSINAKQEKLEVFKMLSRPLKVSPTSLSTFVCFVLLPL